MGKMTGFLYSVDISHHFIFKPSLKPRISQKSWQLVRAPFFYYLYLVCGEVQRLIPNPWKAIKISGSVGLYFIIGTTLIIQKSIPETNTTGKLQKWTDLKV